MTPHFALSLSFDGIRLQHRAADGWRTVGEVDLDAADLSFELKVLRTKAEALEADLRSKLLLPNEQIKYLTIDTPGADDAARRAAAMDALAGATPYAVSDLAFDISNDGDKTHIAAVARETLSEAETFATEHKFQPVCFAATPEDRAFIGEPFFGLTTAATDLLAPDEELERHRPASITEDEAGPTPEPDLPPEPPVADVGPEITPETETETETIVAQTSDDNTPEAAPEPVNLGKIADPEPAATDKAPPAVGFASRRPTEKITLPSLGGARRDKADKIKEAAVTSGRMPEEPDVPVAETSARSGVAEKRQAEAPPTPKIPPAPKPAVAPGEDAERDRMTIFGARQAQVGGKPRFLGLMLTTALLVVLAGVAAWASVFLDDGLNFSRLFGERGPVVAETAAPEIDVPTPQPLAPKIQTASLDPALTSEDTAVLDALSEPAVPEQPQPFSDAEVEAKYAADGIWSRAPQVPPAPAGLVALDDLYLTSIDPVSTTTDAVALPPSDGFATDVVLASVASPAAAGTRFRLDGNGQVIPTALGALSPDGFTVFLGRPPVVPPDTPTRSLSEPDDPVVLSALAAFRPQPRPGDLAETTERAQLDGLTRSELAAYRPALRPQSLQEQAAAAAPAPVDTDAAVTEALTEPDPIATATRLAAAASLRPDVRPRNFAQTVQRAQRAAPTEETRVASAAAVAPRAVTPKIPSNASVSRAATTKNAINLRNVNLIGVYGKPSSRRALVRLSNGRYKKVVVGDRIDGGVVSAIGEGELRYRKRGRDQILKMPK